MGNVTAVNTTLAAGTDSQAFCYDELNRLTWASSASGSVPCGGTLTAGSLTSAQYTQTFAYDTLDRLTSGPLGTYTYGDSAHLHAATTVGTSWAAAYDAAGNMTCRAPTSSTTCAGTPTGAKLTYDNEGHLSGWQNTPSSPTSCASFLYDGGGNRVQQQVSGGTDCATLTSTTTYVSSLEEITSSTLTKYFPAAGAMRVGSALSYLATDGLDSVSEALDGSGNVTFQQLYTPYGSSRYTSGTSPTSYAFAGQRADSISGLDYYHARYYDPVAGQFTSADTVADGLNRYAYVRGNPTSATDPTGHYSCGLDSCGAGGSGGGSSGCTSNCGPPPCTSNCGPPTCHINCDHHGGTARSGCGGCLSALSTDGGASSSCGSPSSCLGVSVITDYVGVCSGAGNVCNWSSGLSSDSLWGIIPGDPFHNAEVLIGVGLVGLERVIYWLGQVSDAGWSWYDNQQKALGVLTGISAIGAAIPGVDIVGILGVAVGSEGIANSLNAQSAFVDMVQGAKNRLQLLHDRLSTAETTHPEWDNLEFMVTAVDSNGLAYTNAGWKDSHFEFKVLQPMS
jgi:RHS repeat-associated protein